MSNTLLNLLADGELHSGEMLAERLGISRTAVWKQVGRALDNGYPIETVRGKGYRLTGGLDLLSAARIRDLLPDAVQERVQLLVLDETDSTNAEIGRSGHGWSADKVPVCVADMQKEGRGGAADVGTARVGKTCISAWGCRLKVAFHPGWTEPGIWCCGCRSVARAACRIRV